MELSEEGRDALNEQYADARAEAQADVLEALVGLVDAVTGGPRAEFMDADTKDAIESAKAAIAGAKE